MSSPFIIINEIEELLNDMNDGLTSTLSTINTNVNTIKTDVSAVKSATATNNTPSKTGVLSAKSAYIISLLENSTYGLSAIKNAITSNSGCLKSVTKTYTNVASGTATGLTNAQYAGLYSIYANGTLYISSEYAPRVSGTGFAMSYDIYDNDVSNKYNNAVFRVGTSYTVGYNVSYASLWIAGNKIENVHLINNSKYSFTGSITYYYFE